MKIRNKTDVDYRTSVGLLKANSTKDISDDLANGLLESHPDKFEKVENEEPVEAPESESIDNEDD